ncbi:VOC family protein [Nakamurella sp. YIM 132087]|uniref:VOC family protein n=1 Tax=Nakamurella alba TaxID=2665158 RepID=A0A7K1FP98_9ACTN|nr:VOC family protein [Nakamurella alba]MTD15910.1 VOC family protein [Nakamurella alba]
MGMTIEQWSIDANDPVVVARWWAEVMRWQFVEPSAEDLADPLGPEEVWIHTPGDDTEGWLFVRVPEAKSIKNRIHVDLRPDDQDAEVERAIGMGATRVDVGQGDVSWVVLADPFGNEFCILSSRKA